MDTNTITPEQLERTNKQRRAQQTERLIDECGINEFLYLVANICLEKAIHLRENWQDNNAAKLWDKNAQLIEKIIPKIYS